MRVRFHPAETDPRCPSESGAAQAEREDASTRTGCARLFQVMLPSTCMHYRQHGTTLPPCGSDDTRWRCMHDRPTHLSTSCRLPRSMYACCSAQRSLVSSSYHSPKQLDATARYRSNPRRAIPARQWTHVIVAWRSRTSVCKLHARIPGLAQRMCAPRRARRRNCLKRGGHRRAHQHNSGCHKETTGWAKVLVGPPTHEAP